MNPDRDRYVIGTILMISLICSAVILIFAVISSPTIPLPVISYMDSAEYSRSMSEALDEFSVNINTADQNRLEELPGIGEVIAKRIIAFREENGPFASVEELTSVKGIGNKTLEKLRPYIFVN